MGLSGFKSLQSGSRWNGISIKWDSPQHFGLNLEKNMFLIFKFCKMKIQIFYEKVVSFDKTQ